MELNKFQDKTINPIIQKVEGLTLTKSKE